MSVTNFSKLIISGVILIVSGYALLIIYLTWPISEISINKAGVFGDSFGIITSLFSGLAFAGLIITILLQKEELGLQRKELKLTRIELKGQRDIMQAQHDQVTIQNFEGTFFQMLRLHNELLHSMDMTTGGITSGNIGTALKVHSGTDYFLMAWRNSGFDLNVQETKDERKKQINEKYDSLWNRYEKDFGHYFRSLYNVIKFVHNSSIENKKDYTNIVRAQLSGQELLIIFYNCIYFSDSKFIPLIEKYTLLKHIPKNEVASKIDYKFYEYSAFGDKYP